MPGTLQDIAFLDVEASALINGWPISVGWFSLGPSGLADGVGWSSLILPDEAWLTVGGWDHIAEHLHGISRDQLIAEGMQLAEVAQRLNADLSGKAAVLSDAPGTDNGWLAELHWAAGVPATYSLRPLEAIADLVPGLVLPPHWRTQRAAVAQRFGLRQHRALDDARTLAGLVWLASKGELN